MLDKSCHTIVLTTMSRHDDSSDIVKQCCFILSHLVNTGKIYIITLSYIKVKYNTLNKCEKKGEILEYTSQVINL